MFTYRFLCERKSLFLWDKCSLGMHEAGCLCVCLRSKWAEGPLGSGLQDPVCLTALVALEDSSCQLSDLSTLRTIQIVIWPKQEHLFCGVPNRPGSASHLPLARSKGRYTSGGEIRKDFILVRPNK